MKKKIRVCVLFGGKSGEHEVSLNSAASVIAHLDRSRYEVFPVAISREGRWLSPGESLQYLKADTREEFSRLLTKKEQETDPGRELMAYSASSERFFDVVFPVLHGPYGEDGTLQGFLELTGVPFVGSDTLSSALAMDKLMAKKIFLADEIPTPQYWFLRAGDELGMFGVEG